MKTFHVVIHHIFTKTVTWNQCPYFTDEETEAQGDKVICLKIFSCYEVAEHEPETQVL